MLDQSRVSATDQERGTIKKTALDQWKTLDHSREQPVKTPIDLPTYKAPPIEVACVKPLRPLLRLLRSSAFAKPTARQSFAAITLLRPGEDRLTQ